MSVQEISESPQIPTKEDAANQSLFDQLMYALIAWFPQFIAELNQLGSDLFSLAQDVEATATQAVGLEHYQGTWSAGSYTQGQSVFHSYGFFIANVNTSAVPGADGDWQLIRYETKFESIAVDTDAIGFTTYNLEAALVLTLPPSPLNDTRIGVIVPVGSAGGTIARNGKLIHGLAEDLTIDADKTSFELIYVNATTGWIIG